MAEKWDADSLEQLLLMCLSDDDAKRASSFLIKVDNLAITLILGVALDVEDYIASWKRQQRKTLRRIALSRCRAEMADVYREELKLEIESLRKCLCCAEDRIRVMEHQLDGCLRIVRRNDWEKWSTKQVAVKMETIKNKMPKFVQVARGEYEVPEEEEPDEDIVRWKRYIFASRSRRSRLRGEVEPEVERWMELNLAWTEVGRFEQLNKELGELYKFRRDAQIALKKHECRLHVLREAGLEYESEILAAQDREGRPPIYSIEDTEQWYKELKDVEIYHSWGGKKKLIEELIRRHAEKTGEPPSVRQMERHLQRIKEQNQKQN